MPSRETSDHKRSQRPEQEPEEAFDGPEATGGSSAQESAHREEMNADIDDLLDEIDGVLEENAEDFVKSFVQKGGQ